MFVLAALCSASLAVAQGRDALIAVARRERAASLSCSFTIEPGRTIPNFNSLDNFMRLSR
jgi:hypothetical protein